MRRRLTPKLRLAALPLWRLGEALAAGAALVAVLPLALLPPAASRRLGGLYGRIAALVWRRPLRVARINRMRALGETPEQAAEGSRRTLSRLAESLAEGLSLGLRLRGPGDHTRRLYAVADPELERRVLAESRPLVFATAHLGSWEVLHLALSRLFGERGAAIVRRVDNPFLHRLVVWLRAGAGEQWIEKRGGAREALRRLRAGVSVSLLADENAGDKGLFVPFFGRPASTSRTPALLSLSTGSPLVVGALLRQPGTPPGRVLHLRILEPADYGRGKDALLAMTTDLNRTLEEWIRRQPDQWRWIHWRWRRRPSGAEERYGRAELRIVSAESSARRASGASSAGEPAARRSS